MEKEVNKIDSEYKEYKTVAEVQSATSQEATQIQLKKLGPSAYTTDDVGVRTFRLYKSWPQEEGRVKGHVTVGAGYYIYWDGKQYLKKVQEDWKAMQQEIERERTELRHKMQWAMHWAKLKQNFLQKLEQIQAEKS